MISELTGYLSNIEYDYDFVIAALIVSLCSFLAGTKKNKRVSLANRIFYLAQFLNIVNCILTLAELIVRFNGDVFSGKLFLPLKSISLILMLFVVCLIYLYIRCYDETNERRRIRIDICAGVVVLAIGIGVATAIVNLFTGRVFYMNPDGSIFHSTSYYYIFGSICVIVCMLQLAAVILGRKRMTVGQRLSALGTVLIPILFMWLESDAVFPNHVLTIFGFAVALIPVQISLENSDYVALKTTLAQLEESKSEAIAAKDEAEHANMAKTDFLARMSHEIRTPMNAILGMTEMIVEKEKDEAVLGYAKDVHKAGEHLLQIINDILDFSRIESGKMELNCDDYMLAELLHDEWSLFDSLAGDKSLLFEFDIDESIPSVLYGDYGKMKQILTNILSNAIKYTEKGSVRLEVCMVEKDNENVRLRFSVKDTGRGMKPEDIAMIFSPFERFEEKKNKVIEGTGLGVNITEQLLELMGSELGIDSIYGEGSDFHFELSQRIRSIEPILDWRESLDVHLPSLKTESIRAPKATVLVVDDTPVNLKLFETFLKDTQIRVAAASSGEEALEFAQIRKFDVIFMDHLMPGMDGIDTLKEIRKDKAGLNATTPIIVLTANAVKGADAEYRKAGFNDVMFKPYTKMELNRQLWRYISADKIENL